MKRDVGDEHYRPKELLWEGRMDGGVGEQHRASSMLEHRVRHGEEYDI